MTLATGDMSFAYDAKGARYMEIASSGITRYGPNGYQKLIASSGITHRHELGPVVINRVGSTDTVRYLLRDRLGSTIAVGDTAGTLIERRQFDAFGRARNADFSDRPAGQANLTNTNLGFTGHTQADDAWLVHMNGRLYDQNLGRFLSVDPIVQGGGSQAINPYSYIENNPLSGSDPSGYAPEKEECAGTNAGGCAEVPLTKAAVLTGSHIRGGGSGGSAFSVIAVNPSAAGQAELAVALAGSSSGYVVQTSAIESAAKIIAADQERLADRSPRAQDRPSKDEAVRQGGGSPLMMMLQVAAYTQVPTSSSTQGLQVVGDQDFKDIVAEVERRAIAAGLTIFSDLRSSSRLIEIKEESPTSIYGKIGDSSTITVRWRPTEAALVMTSSVGKNRRALQSAALGLIHELGHAYDMVFNTKATHAYALQNAGKLPERGVIYGVEKRWANYYREPIRDESYAHGGVFVEKRDPFEHTEVMPRK